jgi:DNA-binding response OmpR family regulator
MGEVMSPFDSAVPAGQPAVLLVQHNRFLNEMMCDWMRGAGYAAFSAADEREALRALNQRRFDLIMLDLDLQRGEGLSLLCSVESKLAGTPLILLTGPVNYDDVLARIPADTPCVQVGKPYSFFALGLVMKSALARAQPANESTPGARRTSCDQRRPGVDSEADPIDPET